VAGPERHHPAAPALRHRQRKQIAHEVDDVLEVVVKADPFSGVSTNPCAILVVKLRRAADPGVEAGIFGQRRGNNTLSKIGLDQDQRFAFGRRAIANRADIQRRMRPGGLGEVLDDAGDVIVSFDQEHVARLQGRAESIGIRWRKRLVALHGLFEIVG